MVGSLCFAAAGVFIALMLELQDGSDIVSGGFDGCYTCFASDQVSWASKPANWPAIARYAQAKGRCVRVIDSTCCELVSRF